MSTQILRANLCAGAAALPARRASIVPGPFRTRSGHLWRDRVQHVSLARRWSTTSIGNRPREFEWPMENCRALCARIKRSDGRLWIFKWGSLFWLRYRIDTVAVVISRDLENPPVIDRPDKEATWRLKWTPQRGVGSASSTIVFDVTISLAPLLFRWFTRSCCSLPQLRWFKITVKLMIAWCKIYQYSHNIWYAHIRGRPDKYLASPPEGATIARQIYHRVVHSRRRLLSKFQSNRNRSFVLTACGNGLVRGFPKIDRKSVV